VQALGGLLRGQQFDHKRGFRYGGDAGAGSSKILSHSFGLLTTGTSALSVETIIRPSGSMMTQCTRTPAACMALIAFVMWF
jgi:hypothetical protein